MIESFRRILAVLLVGALVDFRSYGVVFEHAAWGETSAVPISKTFLPMESQALQPFPAWMNQTILEDSIWAAKMRRWSSNVLLFGATVFSLKEVWHHPYVLIMGGLIWGMSLMSGSEPSADELIAQVISHTLEHRYEEVVRICNTLWDHPQMDYWKLYRIIPMWSEALGKQASSLQKSTDDRLELLGHIFRNAQKSVKIITDPMVLAQANLAMATALFEMGAVYGELNRGDKIEDSYKQALKFLKREVLEKSGSSSGKALWYEWFKLRYLAFWNLAKLYEALWMGTGKRAVLKEEVNAYREAFVNQEEMPPAQDRTNIVVCAFKLVTSLLELNEFQEGLRADSILEAERIVTDMEFWMSDQINEIPYQQALLFSRGYLAETKDEVDAAIALYRQVYSLGDNDAVAERLARLYMRRKNIPEALAWTEKIGIPEPLRLLDRGQIYLAAGSNEKAFDTLWSVYAQNPYTQFLSELGRLDEFFRALIQASVRSGKVAEGVQVLQTLVVDRREDPNKIVRMLAGSLTSGESAQLIDSYAWQTSTDRQRAFLRPARGLSSILASYEKLEQRAKEVPDLPLDEWKSTLAAIEQDYPMPPKILAAEFAPRLKAIEQQVRDLKALLKDHVEKSPEDMQLESYSRLEDELMKIETLAQLDRWQTEFDAANMNIVESVAPLFGDLEKQAKILRERLTTEELTRQQGIFSELKRQLDEMLGRDLGYWQIDGNRTQPENWKTAALAAVAALPSPIPTWLAPAILCSHADAVASIDELTRRITEHGLQAERTKALRPYADLDARLTRVERLPGEMLRRAALAVWEASRARTLEAVPAHWQAEAQAKERALKFDDRIAALRRLIDDEERLLEEEKKYEDSKARLAELERSFESRWSEAAYASELDAVDASIRSVMFGLDGEARSLASHLKPIERALLTSVKSLRDRIAQKVQEHVSLAELTLRKLTFRLKSLSDDRPSEPQDFASEIKDLETLSIDIATFSGSLTGLAAERLKERADTLLRQSEEAKTAKEGELRNLREKIALHQEWATLEIDLAGLHGATDRERLPALDSKISSLEGRSVRWKADWTNVMSRVATARSEAETRISAAELSAAAARARALHEEELAAQRVRQAQQAADAQLQRVSHNLPAAIPAMVPGRPASDQRAETHVRERRPRGGRRERERREQIDRRRAESRTDSRVPVVHETVPVPEPTVRPIEELFQAFVVELDRKRVAYDVAGPNVLRIGAVGKGVLVKLEGSTLIVRDVSLFSKVFYEIEMSAGVVRLWDRHNIPKVIQIMEGPGEPLTLSHTPDGRICLDLGPEWNLSLNSWVTGQKAHSGLSQQTSMLFFHEALLSEEIHEPVAEEPLATHQHEPEPVVSVMATSLPLVVGFDIVRDLVFQEPNRTMYDLIEALRFAPLEGQWLRNLADAAGQALQANRSLAHESLEALLAAIKSDEEWNAARMAFVEKYLPAFSDLGDEQRDTLLFNLEWNFTSLVSLTIQPLQFSVFLSNWLKHKVQETPAGKLQEQFRRLSTELTRFELNVPENYRTHSVGRVLRAAASGDPAIAEWVALGDALLGSYATVDDDSFFITGLVVRVFHDSLFVQTRRELNQQRQAAA